MLSNTCLYVLLSEFYKEYNRFHIGGKPGSNIAYWHLYLYAFLGSRTCIRIFFDNCSKHINIDLVLKICRYVELNNSLMLA